MGKYLLSPLSVVVVLLCILAAVLYFKESDTSAGGRGYRGGATPVVTAVATLNETRQTIEAIGTAQANESVTLSVQQSGIVEALFFDDGDTVKEGQLLMKLDSKEEQARLKELNISLAEASRQLNRIQGLAQDNVASQQLLDEQQGQVNVLKAQVEVVESQLLELQVVAPFSGVLGYRQVSKGALLRPGDVMTTLDDITKIKVDFSVPETFFSVIERGLMIEATASAATGVKFNGLVSSVDSRIDPITRAFTVRAIIDNSDAHLRPGMLLNITVNGNTVQRVSVPESALIPSGNGHYVYIVGEEGKVSIRDVTIGQRLPGTAEVVNGLSEGEIVVTQGAMKLRPGSQVTATDKS